jgi:hypothetical protein
MSAIQIELPEPVHRRATQLAQQQSMSLDRLMVVALVEKLAVMFPDDALEERAKRGTPQGFQEFMQGVPVVEPPDFDRLSDGLQPGK